MKSNQEIVQTVLKAVSVAMAVASVVLGYLGAADTSTQVTFLSIGLFTLSLVALQSKDA
ncbi:MAG: hypothetical protein H8D34_27875 [Chloroflexi bacterium]|nr:hypothetical protein [Chloroflexota bacterium]